MTSHTIANINKNNKEIIVFLLLKIHVGDIRIDTTWLGFV